jgi:Glycosyl transferase family 2
MVRSQKGCLRTVYLKFGMHRGKCYKTCILTMAATPSNASTKTRRVKRTLILTSGIFLYTIGQLLGFHQVGEDILRNYLIDAASSVDASNNDKIIGIQWKNRNYMMHPVTETESNFISNMTTVEHAKKMNHTTNNLKVAVCHPTMFGDIVLDTHFAWVSYYRLLGFDHIFLWYEGNISKLPRFDELAALPYVTLTLRNNSGSKEVYHGQSRVEKECFAMANHSRFDWALAIDVDEYIWFQKPQSIQNFLAHYESQGYTYISLGKHHYSTRHVYNGTMTTTARQQEEAAPADAGFGLEQYPYTPGPYCYGNRGNSKCPTWTGRCKVLAKPSKFPSVDIHVSEQR